MTETPSVTRYEREEQRVTNAESNAAPHHTTPHHTTKNTSSRNDALARGRALEESTTSRLRGISPVDALTVALLSVRPDWRPEHVAGVLARDRRPWATVVGAALHAALDPDVRTPAAIENHDARRYGPSEAERHPSAITYAERMAELRRITEGDA